MSPPYGDGDRWQLFNLEEDPRELNDLADAMPGRVSQLEGQWRAYAEYVGYVESDGTSAAAELGIDRFFEFRLARLNSLLSSALDHLRPGGGRFVAGVGR